MYGIIRYVFLYPFMNFLKIPWSNSWVWVIPRGLTELPHHDPPPPHPTPPHPLKTIKRAQIAIICNIYCLVSHPPHPTITVHLWAQTGSFLMGWITTFPFWLTIKCQMQIQTCKKAECEWASLFGELALTHLELEVCSNWSNFHDSFRVF